jgi:ABC-2 type transport system ATP-binding protein
MTIILTTHYLEEAEELADRVGIIDRGRLLLLEEKQQLMRRMGERRLAVRFARPVDALPEMATSAAAQLSDDRLVLTYRERTGCPASGEILGALYSAGLPVLDVETRSPRLEDILLQVLRAPAGQS